MARLLAHASRDELLGSQDAVPRWRSSMLESVKDEVSGGRIDVLHGHELLVEDNLLSNVGAGHSTNASYIFQNY